MVENITIRNAVTNAEIELDMLYTPNFILDNVDWGVIESSRQTFKYINQVGIYVVSTALETRDVTITGWVVAPSMLGIEEHKAILNKFVNPQQPIDLFYKTYTLQFLPTHSIRYGKTMEDNNEYMCKFVIDGISPYPLFADRDESSNLIASVKGQFHFPLIIPPLPNPPGGVIFGIRDTNVAITLVNSGAVDTGVRIVFRASGDVVNPSLTNVITQRYFKLNKTLQAGEVVEINTDIGNKSITGRYQGVTSNYFRYRDLGSSWLQLLVGENTFIQSADSGVNSLEVFLHFSNKYLEVQ